jgi:hypothetical protein
MPDMKAYKLRDAPEPIGAPRLLNAAAWLERLAALESEFQDSAESGRGREREDPGATPRIMKPARYF